MIVNLVNNKFYVGSSNDIYRRWREHRTRLNCQRHDNPYLSKAWTKYGQRSFKFILVEQCNVKDLIDIEQWYLDNLICEYNIRSQADRKEIPVSVRAKLSEAGLGRKQSAETCKKISDAQKGSKNHNYGKKASLSTRSKMSNKRKRGQNPMATIISQYDLDDKFIRSFNCIADAAEFIGRDSSSISKCASGLRSTCGGYRWKYHESIQS